jgi:hypothetical protein
MDVSTVKILRVQHLPKGCTLVIGTADALYAKRTYSVDRHL